MYLYLIGDEERGRDIEWKVRDTHLDVFDRQQVARASRWACRSQGDSHLQILQKISSKTSQMVLPIVLSSGNKD